MKIKKIILYTYLLAVSWLSTFNSNAIAETAKSEEPVEESIDIENHQEALMQDHIKIVGIVKSHIITNYDLKQYRQILQIFQEINPNICISDRMLLERQIEDVASLEFGILITKSEKGFAEIVKKVTEDQDSIYEFYKYSSEAKGIQPMGKEDFFQYLISKDIELEEIAEHIASKNMKEIIIRSQANSIPISDELIKEKIELIGQPDTPQLRESVKLQISINQAVMAYQKNLNDFKKSIIIEYLI